MNNQNNYNPNPNQNVQQPQMNPSQYTQQPQMNPSQYTQQPQMNPPQNVQQQTYQVQSDKPKDDHIPNILCIISLICMFVVPFVDYAVLFLLEETSLSDDLLQSISSIAVGIMMIANLAAWVLMIIVRIKYKHNRFGLILMIIYLILLVLAIIGIIVMVASCISCLRDCHGM